MGRSESGPRSDTPHTARVARTSRVNRHSAHRDEQTNGGRDGRTAEKVRWVASSRPSVRLHYTDSTTSDRAGRPFARIYCAETDASPPAFALPRALRPPFSLHSRSPHPSFAPPPNEQSGLRHHDSHWRRGIHGSSSCCNRCDGCIDPLAASHAAHSFPRHHTAGFATRVRTAGARTIHHSTQEHQRRRSISRGGVASKRIASDAANSIGGAGTVADGRHALRPRAVAATLSVAAGCAVWLGSRRHCCCWNHSTTG